MPDIQKPSGFDLITKLLLPALSLVAFILAQISGSQALRWPLLSLVFLFAAVGFGSQATALARRRLLKKQKSQLAQRLFPELKAVASHFGKFIAPSSPETLHVTLQHEAAFAVSELHLPSPDLVYYPWYYLNNRIQRQNTTLDAFVESLTEFDSLVRCYVSNYLFPVFDRMPDQIREKLSGSARRELAVFREQFVHFLTRCTALGEATRPLSPERHPFLGFPAPRPLS